MVSMPGGVQVRPLGQPHPGDQQHVAVRGDLLGAHLAAAARGVARSSPQATGPVSAWCSSMSACSRARRARYTGMISCTGCIDRPRTGSTSGS